jgi:hypothetical protein
MMQFIKSIKVYPLLFYEDYFKPNLTIGVSLFNPESPNQLEEAAMQAMVKIPDTGAAPAYPISEPQS